MKKILKNIFYNLVGTILGTIFVLGIFSTLGIIGTILRIY